MEHSLFQKLCTPSHRFVLFLHTVFIIMGSTEDYSLPDNFLVNDAEDKLAFHAKH
jgi:hypothetical protein